MKNAMKKIMSLVLVAMILVSALPFAASAAGYDVCVDGTPVGVYESITFEQALALSGIDTSAYDVTGVYNIHAGQQNNPFGPGQTIDVAGIGNIIYIWFETTAKSTPAPTPDPDPVPTPDPVVPTAYPMSIDVDGEMKVLTDRVSITYEEVLQMTGLKAADIDYIVYEGSAVSGTQMLDAGDKIDLAGETRIFVFTEDTTSGTTTPPAGSSSNGNGTSDTGYHKLSGTITLRIQIKGTSTYKDVAIKTGIAADGRVTLDEVKSVVKYYYNAVDTDTGILYDGIYIDDSVYGLWMSYAHDVKYTAVDGLYEAASQNNDVRLTVVIDNVKVATYTSSADSTNPKTGDMIMAPVAIMTVSASLLAVVFFLNKKRAF